MGLWVNQPEEGEVVQSCSCNFVGAAPSKGGLHITLSSPTVGLLRVMHKGHGV